MSSGGPAEESKRKHEATPRCYLIFIALALMRFACFNESDERLVILRWSADAPAVVGPKAFCKPCIVAPNVSTSVLVPSALARGPDRRTGLRIRAGRGRDDRVRSVRSDPHATPACTQMSDSSGPAACRDFPNDAGKHYQCFLFKT